MAATTDLISSAYLTNSLAAGGTTLTAAQAAVSAQLITAASRAIRKHCNRRFVRSPSSDLTIPAFDGLYTLDQPGATLLLRQFPVNAILRLCTNPTPVLSISNTATSVNQRATVQLATAGVADEPDVPPIVSGLTLTRVASGVATAVSVPFSANVTVQAVANAVNALGAGWTASVEDAYGLWPSADMRAVQGTLPALGANPAELKIHVDDLPFELSQGTGEVEITDDASDPFSSIRFGPYLSTSADDLQVYGGKNGIRCVYDAGWDTVPEDVQQSCVEVVWDMLGLLRLNQRLGSEGLGSYNYVLNTAFASYAFPKSVMGRLAPYVSHRA